MSIRRIAAFIGFGIAASAFLSCSNTPVSEHQQPGKDSVRSEFTEGLRDPKKYLTDCSVLYLEAKRMDSILLREMDVDHVKADRAIAAFTDFAYYCASDSMAPVYLIKTAQVAKSVNNIPQAKAVLEKCIADYPRFTNLPAALFFLAQLYDEPGYLNDEQEAKRLYEKIVNEHPKSDWAASAKGAIQFIGKSDEELLKELKKKSKP